MFSVSCRTKKTSDYLSCVQVFKKTLKKKSKRQKDIKKEIKKCAR